MPSCLHRNSRQTNNLVFSHLPSLSLKQQPHAEHTTHLPRIDFFVNRSKSRGHRPVHSAQLPNSEIKIKRERRKTLYSFRPLNIKWHHQCCLGMQHLTASFAPICDLRRMTSRLTCCFKFSIFSPSQTWGYNMNEIRISLVTNKQGGWPRFKMKWRQKFKTHHTGLLAVAHLGQSLLQSNHTFQKGFY